MVSSRLERFYSQFPEPVSGYELNPDYGYLSVIVPEETTNLVTNPSVENESNTGYTASSATIANTYDWQAYGACGLKITPNVATEGGFYYGTVSLVSGTTYTASMVIQGEAGKLHYIWIATTAGALLSAKVPWMGTGHKQRIHVTYTETATTTRRIYVTRYGYVDQNLWYADGLQMEAKSYPTTYCDGDQTGFVIGENSYYWTGIAHASTSVRSAQTRSGGREMKLLGLGFRVLAILGLGMAPLVDQSLSMPGWGELAQGTGTTAREFILIGTVFGEGSAGRHLQAVRSALIDVFKPDLVTSDQPLILRYQACDEDGEPMSDSLDIVCKYRTGLEGNWDNHQQERIPLTFKMHLPLIQSTYMSGAALGYQTAIANANYILMRGIDGSWQAMGTGMDGDVYALYFNKGIGRLYVGGAFTTADGVTVNKITYWDGTTFVACQDGSDDDAVRAMVGPGGKLHVGGDFTGMDAQPNTNKIAVFNHTFWGWETGDVDGTGNVYALARGIDPASVDERLYIGGSFATIGGVAGTSRIAMYKDGVAYYPMGTGMNDTVYAIKRAANGDVYAGGAFTTADGITVNRIAMWNGVTWSPLGSGMNGTVYTIEIDDTGNIYAGGDFTTAGGIAASKIAMWNGFAWSPLGVGLNNTVKALKWNPYTFELYAAGGMTKHGYGPNPDRLAAWNGSGWLESDIVLPGTGEATALEIDDKGNLYIGFTSAGTAYVSTDTAINMGSAVGYPTIYMNGPGTPNKLTNFSTGKNIYFALNLEDDENAVLNLAPENLSFNSNFRATLMNTILQGSDLDFFMKSGSNTIRLLMYWGTDAGSGSHMTWRSRYWSLDGAVWK